ncbi:sucrose transport protein SUT1-like [Curcuma longa]|uniref:sucrose transport protein SUT1-like n=1 Tax=Curcuma longa TaxID=136217 RepID=UPI003D9E0716
MAAGNLLGYACGSNGNWHKWFPFLMTNACCEACANLKAAFLIAVVFLLICLTVTLIFANEVPLRDSHLTNQQQSTGFLYIFRSFKNLPPGMPSVLIVTSLTWLSWFPFILFDTDWMGREVYHGDPSGTDAQIHAYEQGVREGAFGLLLNSVVLGLASFIIEPMCRKVTPRVVWVFSNFFVFLGMVAICITSVWSLKRFTQGTIQQAISADVDVKVVSLVVFAALGLPLAVLFSVPFAVASQLAAKVDGGQGLCIGVLNISIVIPQVIIALGAGPWDAIFGHGNLPAFALASALAFVSGVAGTFLLPKLSGNSFNS